MPDPRSRRDTMRDLSSNAEVDLNGNTNGSEQLNNTALNGHTTSASYPPPSSPLAAISLRAFCLGTALGASFVMTFYIAFVSFSPFWRLPVFLSTLSLFHFLEYYITAAYNPAAAGVSAFLLSTNGSAYNVAHSLAFLECTLHFYFRPETPFMAPSSCLRKPSLDLGGDVTKSPVVSLVLGFTMIALGQAVRTMAMIRAGSNFNHIVQTKQKQDHVLVTEGIYRILRHPSYFGFWWWGLGTQVMLGNGICLVGYAVVLWRFFNHRIGGESDTSHNNPIAVKTDSLFSEC